MAAKFKDPFCAISHWVGLALAVAGVAFLLAVSLNKPSHLLAFGIYGIGIAILYFASAFYHSVRRSEATENRLQKFDHAAIYVMIATSYVPVCLLALKGSLATNLLVAQGAFMATGILLTMLLKHVPGAVRVILYVSMGWMAVVAMGPLSHVLPQAAISWLIAGGLVYTVGAAIYVLDRPHLVPGKFSAHDLWHVFVIGGSACHFVMFAQFLTPLP